LTAVLHFELCEICGCQPALTTLGGVKLAAEIVFVIVVFGVPLIVVFAFFVWGARKDGEADRAVQRRLGIRRRTRLGR
jgi:hypothetical protein